MSMLVTDTESTHDGLSAGVRGRSRVRRWAVAAVVLLVAACAAVPAWRTARFHGHLSGARRALTRADANGAVAALEAAGQVRPGTAEVEYLLGVAHRRSGHLDRATEHLAHAARLHWSHKQLRRQLLMLSFQAGEIEKTQPAIEELLAASNSDLEAEEIYECLVKAYLSEYRLDQAKTCLDHWISWQPRAVRPRLWRADLFSLIDKQEQLKEYQDVLRIEPENFDARLARAQLLFDAGRVPEARDDYQWCLQKAPSSEVATLGLAGCQRRLGELSLARQILGRLTEREMSGEQRSFVLAETGRLDLAEGAYAAAAEQLAQAVRLDAGNAQAHYSLAQALGHLGRKDEAQRHLDRWKQIDELRSRLTDLERRIIVDPRSSDIRCRVGETLMRLGQKKEAASWYLSALRCDRGDGVAHRALADYYAEIGRGDLADQHRAALASTLTRSASEDPKLTRSVSEDPKLTRSVSEDRP